MSKFVVTGYRFGGAVENGITICRNVAELESVLNREFKTNSRIIVDSAHECTELLDKSEVIPLIKRLSE